MIRILRITQLNFFLRPQEKQYHVLKRYPSKIRDNAWSSHSCNLTIWDTWISDNVEYLSFCRFSNAIGERLKTSLKKQIEKSKKKRCISFPDVSCSYYNKIRVRFNETFFFFVFLHSLKTAIIYRGDVESPVYDGWFLTISPTREEERQKNKKKKEKNEEEEEEKK